MTTNPGGVVDPDDLIGRSESLATLYQAVNVGGAKVLGDRRMGKTSMLGAAQRELQRVGHTVVRVSAETSDPSIFARHLLLQMRTEHVLRKAISHWEAELGGELNVNVGVASFKLSAKAQSGDRSQPADLDLFQSCSRAVKDAGPFRIIFIFDEITALARGLSSGGAGHAEEFFRTMRVPRQELSNVSVIIAGSIGLHHVLHDMAPVNDISPITVGPLSTDDGIYLARCLLRGANISYTNEELAARAIVKECAAVPFYIHKLVQKLDESGTRFVDGPLIQAMVTQILEHESDEWQMRHYDTRLDEYYGPNAVIARRVVDLFSLANNGLTLAELSGQLLAAGDINQPNRDALLSIVDRLESDHYLTRIGSVDHMATALLRRAWLINRRLV